MKTHFHTLYESMGTKTRLRERLKEIRKWPIGFWLIRKMCNNKTPTIKWYFIFPSHVNYSLEHQAVHDVLTIQIQKSVKQTQ